MSTAGDGNAAPPQLPSGSAMSPEDYQLCLHVVTRLASNVHSSLNYLFLEPVDTTYFPTYNTIILRPIDLGTLRGNLISGTVYANRDEFFKDLMLIFENAIQFHSAIKENAWIVKLAKDMMKLANKEKKNAFKKFKVTATAEIGEGGGGGSGTTKAKKRKNSTEGAGSSVGGKKIKLSVSSVPSSSAASVASAATGAAGTVSDASTTTPAVAVSNIAVAVSNIAETLPSEGAAVTAAAIAATTVKVKNSSSKSKKEKGDGKGETKKEENKPKLKLRLSIKLKPEQQQPSSMPNEDGKADASAVAMSTQPSSSDKKNGKSKSSSSVASNASRGKELPKNVAAMQQQLKQQQKKDAQQAASTGAETPAPSTPKLQVRLHPPSRGKEAPKVVQQQSQQQPIGGTKVTKPVAAPAAPAPGMPPPVSMAPPSSAVPLHAPIAAAIGMSLPLSMTPERKTRCLKFISALKRRQHRNVSWFVKPVNDPRIIEDYTAKIPFPTDLGTVTSKLENNVYATIPEFVRDIRRICGNCLRYNTTAGDTFRPVAVEMTRETESLLSLFVQHPERPHVMYAYPPLLYCWQVCVASLDVLLAMKNPEDELPTAHFFLHPASFYFGGEFPPDYQAKVPVPMDLGTVTSNLMEGVYQSVSIFVADCSLVCQNCYRYNADRTDGAALVAHAQRLEAQMQQQLGALIRYDQSPEGREAERVARMAPPAIIPCPPKQFLLGILQELRETMYTDRFTKLTERAAAPFENPVDVNVFPDYPQYVQNPMCFEMIERNIEMNVYATPEDFEYDVQLIFKSCEAYNLPKKNEHIIAVSRHLSKAFRKLYHNRTRNYEENAIVGNLGLMSTDSIKFEAIDQKRQLAPSPTPSVSSQVSSQTGEKRSKLSKAPSKRSLSRASSIASVDTSSKTSPKPRSITPKVGVGGGKKMGGKKAAQTDVPDTSRPITLIEAIERVHAQYPGRRSVKMLDPWESTCHRLYRELLRHPWLSGTNPKIVVHAPVTTLHPEVANAYLARIEKPMDLSTLETKLLSGGLYSGPQDFVNDIALVFANAIAFNKIGRDEGVATSCAYYDSSKHLLRYSRWLSLDILSNFLMDDSEIGAAPKEGSYSDWKLTTSYKQAARAEMETIALKNPMEKSDVGDRFTWMESECEKLLKAMRHQSDLRYMTYFISPHYPADYAAFISKPMAWETVQRNLQQRKYDTIGEAAEDLRLIFSNALKYNARAKGTDTVSGRAYDAAVYMSIKLEASIQRMLLSVSDRLEREKVEEAIAEREAEAAARSEALRIREEQARLQSEWEKEATEPKEKVEKAVVETIKVMKPKFSVRRQMDFDFEFNEDDVDHEQTHIEAMRQQKALFEMQKNERKMFVQTSKLIGASLFFKLVEKENQLSVGKAEADARRRQEERVVHGQSEHVMEVEAVGTPERSNQSSTASTKMADEKKTIKIALNSKSKPKPKRMLPRITFAD